jgi:single-strand DNA-binding protein
MYQKLVFVGNLGRDPDMRYTPSGQPVTTLSIATNRKWTNSDGTPGEEVTWFRVSVWGSQAEACNKYLAKGAAVLVEGALKPDPATGGPRVWTRQDGTASASFEVTAQVVKFLGGGRSEPEPVEDEADELPF